MKLRKLSVIFAALILAVVLTACGDDDKKEDISLENPEAEDDSENPEMNADQPELGDGKTESQGEKEEKKEPAMGSSSSDLDDLESDVDNNKNDSDQVTSFKSEADPIEGSGSNEELKKEAKQVIEKHTEAQTGDVEDYEQYINTSTKRNDIDEVKESVMEKFDKFDLNITIQDYDFKKVLEDEVDVVVTQKIEATHIQEDQYFDDNISEIEFILKREDGELKLDDADYSDIEYLSDEDEDNK